MKVTFVYPNGKEKVMHHRLAETLQKLKRGVYMTRDMAAAPIAVSPSVFPSAIDLDSMDVEGLHALAKDRGVKVHHNAGAEKVRAALRESAL